MPQKVHVCHITTVHPPYDVRIFHKECCSLADTGYRVSLIVVNGPNEHKNGVELIGVPVEFTSRLQRMRLTPKAIFNKAVEIDADIYHFHDPDFLKYALRLRKMGKEVIYDVHEDVPRQILSKVWIPGPLRKTVSRRFERMEHRIAAQLSHICPATPFISERFLKVNPNTSTIHNFPKLEEWGEPVYDHRKENVICYVGTITAHRGVKELVQSLKGTATKLLLAGRIAEPTLESQLKELPEWKSVDALGIQDREGVKKVYQESNIGIVTLYPITNYVDALPVKLFEYMANGLPVIASDFPRWRAIVDEHQCGLCVDPLDPSAIREAVGHLLANQEEAKAMGERGRKAVEEVYNWQHEANELEQIYLRLSKIVEKNG